MTYIKVLYDEIAGTLYITSFWICFTSYMTYDIFLKKFVSMEYTIKLPTFAVHQLHSVLSFPPLTRSHDWYFFFLSNVPCQNHTTRSSQKETLLQ